MAALKPPLTRADWGLGLRWVLATTVGWVVGFTVCEALKAILEFLAHPPTDGAVIGIGIGLGQLLVLNQRINRTRWWILASIIGFGVGKAVGDVFAQAVPGALGSGLEGVAIGTSLGIAQWLVLRRHVAQARGWILASIPAWTAGWTIISSANLEAAGGSTGTAYVVGAAGAAIAGLITGASLVWLLRRSRPA